MTQCSDTTSLSLCLTPFLMHVGHTQTLSDPDVRAMYDAVAGFSVDAVNPFTDTSFPATEVFVDEVCVCQAAAALPHSSSANQHMPVCSAEQCGSPSNWPLC